MNFSMGIRAQLISGIVVITIAAISFIGVISLSVIENAVLSAKLAEVEKIAKILSVMFNNPIYASDERFIVTVAKGVMKEAGTSSIYLKDASGRVLFTDGRIPDKEGSLIFLHDGVKVRRTSDGVEEVLYATVGEGFPRASAVKAGFTLPLFDVPGYKEKMRWFVAVYAVIDSVIIITLGIYFVSVYITRPVKRLEAAAAKISGGFLGERAEVSGDNEIGSLATAFNAMADRLEEEIKRLERVNRELTEAREEILRTRTLAAVGRLAAGIAHEIGNPLGAISGYVELLKKDVKDEHAKEMLTRAEKEIHRIDGIVKEFLELARPSARPASEVDVNASIEETALLLKAHKDFERVRVEFALKQGLPPVIINEEKLRQVFINLLLNAAWATSALGEGVITITTGLRVLSVAEHAGRRKDDRVFTRPEETAERIFVSFKDTGRGIGKDDLERVFEPFFSTREGGGGLGLFVSQGIIKSYGGRIEAESVEGSGSVFTVILPAKKS